MFQMQIFDGPAKALTLWQPWASALAAGFKQYETRGWATNYRGSLAIHASVKPMTAEYRALAEKYGLRDLPFGKIVCLCDLTDCISMTNDLIASQSRMEIDWGIWSPGRFVWKLANVKALPEPILASGRQGLWNCPHL
jgi:hypothetical protein